MNKENTMRSALVRRTMPAIAAMAGACLLLWGCAGGAPQRPALYDLGPLQTQGAQERRLALPPLAIAGVAAPVWLDSNRMFYRLNHDNPLQPHAYAQSRWTMPPSQLLQQQLKARIAAAGGAVFAASQGAVNVPVLRIETDDFTHVFDSPAASRGQVSLRASLYRGRVLLAHRAFAHAAPAPSVVAAGGAQALAAGADAVIDEMIVWLAAQDLK